MTKQDKQLLLADLCARLPYGVMINYNNYPYPLEVNGISGETIYHTTYFVCGSIEIRNHKIEEVKSYLRPMSTMTEEEAREYANCGNVIAHSPQKDYLIPNPNSIDWINEHHFDYRGLIEKGLALEAPEGMYNLNKE